MSLLTLLLLACSSSAAADAGTHRLDLSAAAGALARTSAEVGAHAPPAEVPQVSAQAAAPAEAYDQDRASALAAAARAVAKRRGTVGHCYEGVAEALEAADIVQSDNDPGAARSWYALGIDSGYGDRAFQFTLWARDMPDKLAAIKLKEVAVPEDPAQLLPGTILVYQRGQCFSRDSGHIEVVAPDPDGSGALVGCSDHCQPLYADCTNGGPDKVAAFIPYR
ncbi:MAG: hypothetical protein NTY77_10065 [Elusimicrobia bacterium]|nr:hypothetical protein [Elusimicrobiota bacterium]